MSDNSYHFTTTVFGLTAAEEAWLRHALRDVGPSLQDVPGEDAAAKRNALREQEPWRRPGAGFPHPPFNFHFVCGATGSELHISGSGSDWPWCVAALMHAFIKAHRPRFIWNMTWSMMGTSGPPNAFTGLPRTEYSGGAVIATKDGWDITSAVDWVVDQLVERCTKMPPTVHGWAEEPAKD